MNQELEEMLLKEIEEMNKKMGIMAGELDDRKSQLTEDQLEIFLDFKEKINSKISEELSTHLTDNIYCRYLQGYVWELKVAEEKMIGMLHWAKSINFYNRKMEEFRDYEAKRVCIKILFNFFRCAINYVKIKKGGLCSILY